MTPVELIIIADGEEKSCNAEMKLKTQINYLSQGMLLAYGEQLGVEFIDLHQTPDHPLAQKMVGEGRRFPLLLMNGEVKFEGDSLLAFESALDQVGLVPRGN